MKDFVEKVKSMTAKEIIMSMVEGLRKPFTEIDMSTYGFTIGGTCFGCAATNTIIKISKLPKRIITSRAESRWGLKNTCSYADTMDKENIPLFMINFESAIDALRRGNIRLYNIKASELGIATIYFSYTHIYYPLPKLEDNYTEEELSKYETLANAQGGRD